jgi:hypothetical protein
VHARQQAYRPTKFKLALPTFLSLLIAVSGKKESSFERGRFIHRKPLFSRKIVPFTLMGLIVLTVIGCSNSLTGLQGNTGKIAICHAGTDAANPYEEISINFEELNAHGEHMDDLIPAPADGCPNIVVPNANDGKLTICHATASASNPYSEITIDFNGLNGHGKHLNDIIPAPESGCLSISETPTVTTTPEATTSESGDQKVTICHATGSAKNPYVMITISVNGLSGHGKHARDIIPAPAGGCPK